MTGYFTKWPTDSDSPAATGKPVVCADADFWPRPKQSHLIQGICWYGVLIQFQRFEYDISVGRYYRPLLDYHRNIGIGVYSVQYWLK